MLSASPGAFGAYAGMNASGLHNLLASTVDEPLQRLIEVRADALLAQQGME